VSLEAVRIGFIGGGAMAEALLGGLAAAGVPAAALEVSEPRAERRAQLAAALRIAAADDNAGLASRCDVVVLAVKPDVVPAVLAGLRERADFDARRPLWISIAAGVTLATLEAALGGAARIVRAMPNTPALVRAGATGFCGNGRADARDLARAEALFASVGISWRAPREELLDAVTGLSGSGPAYVFAFLEALTDAGEAVGLPREAAGRLALETVYGAARLARESERSPAELRRQVSSPGGTTLAGLGRLTARGFADAVRDAVEAATRRAGELGRAGDPRHPKG
jgi:pyrroline-5-carboxylate reductase